MRIVFLEDRPLVITAAIKELRNRNYETAAVFWFCDDSDEEDKGFQERVQTQYNEIGISLIQINKKNFKEQLDNMYQTKDIVFFFDMDLSRDFSEYFEERINVQYAMEKQVEADKNNEMFRIWFYTTGPIAAVAQIMNAFEDHYLPVLEFKAYERQVVFDYNYIEDTIAEEMEHHIHE